MCRECCSFGHQAPKKIEFLHHGAYSFITFVVLIRTSMILESLSKKKDNVISLIR